MPQKRKNLKENTYIWGKFCSDAMKIKKAKNDEYENNDQNVKQEVLENFFHESYTISPYQLPIFKSERSSSLPEMLSFLHPERSLPKANIMSGFDQSNNNFKTTVKTRLKKSSNIKGRSGSADWGNLLDEVLADEISLLNSVELEYWRRYCPIQSYYHDKY